MHATTLNTTFIPAPFPALSARRLRRLLDGVLVGAGLAVGAAGMQLNAISWWLMGG